MSSPSVEVSKAVFDTEVGCTRPEEISDILVSAKDCARARSRVAAAFCIATRATSPKMAMAPPRMTSARMTSRSVKPAFFIRDFLN